MLTVRDVSLRQLLPGAVLAALAWAPLQWLGGWYVARQLSRARRLWPRSLAPPPLGEPDERALEDLARQEERLPSQRVEVSFDGAAEGGQVARDRENAQEPEPRQSG